MPGVCGLDVVGVLRKDVRNDQAISAGCRGRARQRAKAELHERVRVAHQCQWDVGLSTNPLDQMESVLKPDAAFQRDLRGQLHGGTISDGVAERHADFEHVGAGFNVGERQFDGGFTGGIPNGDVGGQDQARFGFG